MNLINYTSLIEIFAGINVALMLSDIFIETINKHFSNAYIKLESEITELKSLARSIKENIDQIPADSTVISFSSSGNVSSRDLAKEKETLHAELLPLEQRIYSQETITTEQKRLSEISCKFKFICLYGFIYCIILLILIGLESEPDNRFVNNHKRFMLEGISLFNIISVFIYIIYMAKDSKHEKLKKLAYRILADGYLNTVKHFIVAFAITSLLITVHSTFYATSIKCDWLITIKCLLSGIMFVSSIHFPYYFIRALIKGKSERAIVTIDLNNLKTDLNNFNSNRVVRVVNVSTFMHEPPKQGEGAH